MTLSESRIFNDMQHRRAIARSLCDSWTSCITCYL